MGNGARNTGLYQCVNLVCVESSPYVILRMYCDHTCSYFSQLILFILMVNLVQWVHCMVDSETWNLRNLNRLFPDQNSSTFIEN